MGTVSVYSSKKRKVRQGRMINTHLLSNELLLRPH